MRKIILTLIIILSCSNAYSIEGWIGYQTPVSVSLSDIFFVNENTGWAVGSSGKIFKSVNGGINWTEQNSNTTKALWSVYFVNENTGWCAGGDINLFTFSNVLVLRTTDGGGTWLPLIDSHILNSHLKKIYFKNSLGFVLGEGGNGGTTEGFIFRTTNSGDNWSSSPSPDYKNYFDVVFKDNNTGWLLTKYTDDIGNDTASVLKTTNGGLNWNKIYARGHLNLYSVHYLANDDILCYGQSYFPGMAGRFILKSSDGGQNWDSTYGPAVGNYWEAEFIDFNTGWAAGTSGVFKTTNGGANFELQLNNPAHSVHFINSLTGWASGNGVVYKTVTGGVTGISPIGSSTPESFNLYQNYPNPFNPATNIKFDIPKSGNVRITVYDITGKQIAELLNENLSPGTYETSWNADGSASGVYFYSLETEGFKETRKMLLIK